MDYPTLFKTATEHTCFDYQHRLAQSTWPQFLDIPTGMGKTAAYVLAWAWKRGLRPGRQRIATGISTPRRLVVCLPMRVLVEQTFEAIRGWLSKLDWLAPPGEGGISVHLLLGGEGGTDTWVEHPDEDMILIGTQDMLLSRALMRGYGMSRYAWPVHYAMLHNDCLWVFDEIQLMGPGLATSAQLEAFRRSFGLGKDSRSLWVSATLNTEWLATVDFRAHLRDAAVFRLSDDEAASPEVGRRRRALKRLTQADTALTETNAKGGAKEYAGTLATEVARRHQAATQTLVIVNTVERAQAVFAALEKSKPDADLLLVHSRFRPAERRALNEALRATPPRGRIVVATQAIEAGVDITSRCLFSELAPWASVVQRFGRCNRYGELGEAGADVRWIDVADSEAAPYQAADFATARARLAGLASAAPADLPPTEDAAPLVPVLRRRDFLDLFNTEPDLTGFDVDVSPYIRDADDADVLIFWRDLSSGAEDQSAPVPEELCRASIGAARTFLKGKAAYVWDGLARRWAALEHVYPGLTVMLDAQAGGYTPHLGFAAGLKAVVPVLPPSQAESAEALEDDRWSHMGQAVTLPRHLCDAEDAAQQLCDTVGEEAGKTAVARACRWHDVGKAHRAFQTMLLTGDPDAAVKEDVLWAKGAVKGRAPYAVCGGPSGYTERKHFRHELASALAWLEHNGEAAQADLIAYLIAAHHGKVRLAIRSLPGETEPPDTETLFARGIWAGDVLPEVAIDDRETIPATRLRLDLMRLGRGPMGESWAARTQKLLTDLGPFRLAWLEALVRVSDWRASRSAQKGAA